MVYKGEKPIQKNINIKIEDENKIIKMNINEQTSIYEIKKNIFEKEKISPGDLFYNGVILEDYVTGYKLEDNSVLTFNKKDQKFIKIYLYNVYRENFFITMLVSPFENIESLKKLIIEKENIKNPENYSVYILPGEKSYLEYGDNLRYYIINKLQKNQNEIKIKIVKGFTDLKYYEVYIKPNDKINSIKLLFCPGKLAERFSLIYKNIRLDGNKTFEDYNIKNDDEIYLALRLRG